MNETNTRALASIVGAVRGAVQQERVSNLMASTRASFRPERGSGRSTPGRSSRNPASVWTKQIFLLRRANTDFYPSPVKASYLEEHGLGELG